MKEAPSRRRFLKTGCLVTAAAGLTVCGGLALASTYQPEIDFVNSIDEDKSMDNKRILIAYASKAGSTGEIAARIGAALSTRGLPVDVLPVGKVTALDAYSTVILGSAIRIGAILPDALKFIQANQAALETKNFSVFIGCMTLNEDNEETRKTVSAYLDPVRALVKPASEGMFAGVIDPKKVGLIDRLVIKMVKAPTGDFRKWDQIDAWAQAVPAAQA